MQLEPSLAEQRVVRLAEGYRHAARNFSRWRRLFTGDVDVMLAARVVARRLASRGMVRLREAARRVRVPLRDDLAEELRKATSGQARMEFIFANGEPGHTMLVEQGGSIVGSLIRSNRLSVLEIADADHTFSTESARKALAGVVWERLSAIRERKVA
jgi:hypothetical protein